jgi:hypothetical protein
MHVFDAPMHGKHISLRDFSNKYEQVARQDDVDGEDCHAGLQKKNLWWHVFPSCAACAMTFVYARQAEVRDWGPQASLFHFFLAAFLPLRIYGRLFCLDKTHVVWPCLALHVAVMLCAYPYETERVSTVVFVGVLLCGGFYASESVRVRSLAANAATLLVILNAVLCLMVYANDRQLASTYYHVSFALIFFNFIAT